MLLCLDQLAWLSGFQVLLVLFSLGFPLALSKLSSYLVGLDCFSGWLLVLRLALL